MRVLVLATATICGTLGSIAAARPLRPCAPGPSLRHCVEARAEALFAAIRAETLADLGPARPFAVPNRFHQRGRENEGLFRVVGPDGARGLVKLLRDKGFGGDVILRFEILGMVLAESLGGPVVRRVGKLEKRGTYFVEMEEMYPDDAASFTLKGLRDRRRSTLRPARPQLGAVARLVLAAMEQGIAVRDPDLLFSGDGGVRWLDGAHWGWTEEHQRFPLQAYASYATVFEELRRINPAYAEMTLFELRAAIGRSGAWSAGQRERHWAKLRDELKYEFDFADAVLDHPRAHVEPTPVPTFGERCEAFFHKYLTN